MTVEDSTVFRGVNKEVKVLASEKAPRRRAGDDQGYNGDEGDQHGGGHERVAVIVGGAVGALIAAADLADVQHVELVRLHQRFVEAFRRVVVVDADGQVTRHVGHWIPSLEGEMNARVLSIQQVKVEHHLSTNTNQSISNSLIN